LIQACSLVSVHWPAGSDIHVEENFRRRRFFVALAPAAAADPFSVKGRPDRHAEARLPANSVVIGNATVADVSVADARTLLITGKAFGATNLTVLDRAGNTIYTNQLVVGGEPEDGLTIVRAGGTYLVLMRRQMPRHRMVGDAPQHFSM